ncbi:hypothetical protein BGW38_008945 [Lunasporangiospora selenospora]|uniref:Alginate lyase domain-containing protein n=1 Tax=Lunasporangiospora selenospora TaxID=979761 RepID=A0A9P6FY43_9FUNG|nr:hypothetical protein BGW38_008945 [Lunasporangiospora selenospora]
MAYLRGPTKRTLAIVLGLCIFMLLLTLTPYSDNSLDHSGWREDTPDLDEIAFRQESAERERQIERQRQQDVVERKQQQQSLDQLEQDRLEQDRLRNQPQHNDADEDDDAEDTEEADESADGLPTEFSELRFPAESQQRLEAEIGRERLARYLGEGQNREAREVAVRYVLGQANIAHRNNSVYSVVIKPKSKYPPSGDKHDYSSLARYLEKSQYELWTAPNPDMDLVWDYRLLRKMFRDCHFMGHAYFWTGDERYAEKIVFRVKQWFLDADTKMNPNLKYGSLIFGNELGRAQGVLDMFKVYAMFDALKTIRGSKAMQAEPTLIKDLQAWFSSYLDWMHSSVQANQERNAHNNHGTYYSVQYISILEFLGRTADARAQAEDAKSGMMLLAMQADTFGVDLWHHVGPVEEKEIRVNSKKTIPIKVGGGTIEDATKYLSEYAIKDPSEWPYPDSGTRNIRDVLKMARVASLVYGQDRWQGLIESLEAKLDEVASGSGEHGEGAEGEGKGHNAPDDGDPNGFVCELGILSKGSLWHCYK